MFAAPKRAKRVAALFKPQGYAVFVGVLVKLFVGLAELTPIIFSMMTSQRQQDPL